MESKFSEGLRKIAASGSIGKALLRVPTYSSSYFDNFSIDDAYKNMPKTPGWGVGDKEKKVSDNKQSAQHNTNPAFNAQPAEVKPVELSTTYNTMPPPVITAQLSDSSGQGNNQG